MKEGVKQEEKEEDKVGQKEEKAVKHHGKNSKLPEIEGDEDKIIWFAPEFVYRDKSTDWYWIMGIGIVTLVVIAFLLQSILFGLFSLVAGGAVMLYGSKKPDTATFEVNERGVQTKDMLYPYPTLDFFWIDEEGEATLLIIEAKKTTAQHIILPVQGVSSNELRDFLLDHLREEHIERPWSEQLMERLGF